MSVSVVFPKDFSNQMATKKVTKRTTALTNISDHSITVQEAVVEAAQAAASGD